MRRWNILAELPVQHRDLGFSGEPDSSQSLACCLSGDLISHVGIQRMAVILDLGAIGGLYHCQLPAQALGGDDAHAGIQKGRPGGSACSGTG